MKFLSTHNPLCRNILGNSAFENIIKMKKIMDIMISKYLLITIYRFVSRYGTHYDSTIATILAFHILTTCHHNMLSIFGIYAFYQLHENQTKVTRCSSITRPKISKPVESLDIVLIYDQKACYGFGLI